MKKARMKRDGIPLLLIFSGVLILLITLAWEAYRYPWTTVFGGSQTDSALPDPPPIVWSGKGPESSAAGGVSSDASPASSYATLPGNEVPEDGKPVRYTELGIIKIPKLNLSQNVLEGSQSQMHYGVGHVTGTAPLGGDGNCALAGHNTTSFRYLSKLSAGDKVFLKANGKVFAYSVIRSFTVLPTEVSVLNNVPGESAIVTLITCTPYLTGTHRLIVQARLTGIDGSAPPAAPKPGYAADSALTPSVSTAPQTFSGPVPAN